MWQDEVTKDLYKAGITNLKKKSLLNENNPSELSSS